MRLSVFAILSFAALAAVSQAATRIDDPSKFVKMMYATKVGKVQEPDDIYTPRLSALFALDTKEANGEVGRMDFDFWMNAQDGSISGATVSEAAVENAPSRMIVTAKFKNEQTPNEIHLYFEKTPQGWKLDDARSVKGEPWVLSILLKYGE